jgi:hypothetical protein
MRESETFGLEDASMTPLRLAGVGKSDVKGIQAMEASLAGVEERRDGGGDRFIVVHIAKIEEKTTTTRRGHCPDDRVRLVSRHFCLSPD